MRERSRERKPRAENQVWEAPVFREKRRRSSEGMVSHLPPKHVPPLRSPRSGFWQLYVWRRPGQQEFRRVILRWGQVSWGKLRGVAVYPGTRRARPALGHQSRQPGLPAPGGFHHPKWVRTSLPVRPPPHTPPRSFLFSAPLTWTPSPVCCPSFLPDPPPPEVIWTPRLLTGTVLCTAPLSTTSPTASSCC